MKNGFFIAEYPNDRLLVQNLHTTNLRKKIKKKSYRRLYRNRVVLGAPQRNNLRCELERSLAFVPTGSCVPLRDTTKMLRFEPQHIAFFGARSPRLPS